MFGQPDIARSERDRGILMEVRDRLYKYDPVREIGAPIGIEVRDGVVTLTGWVRALSHKKRVAQLVAGVTGVQEVHNRLFCDDELVPAVARALAEDPRMAHDFPGVHISSYLGRVVLSGYVAGQEEWNTVDDVAARVPGVRSVDNRLRVAPEELARLQA